jgi:hypothetical protein
MEQQRKTELPRKMEQHRKTELHRKMEQHHKAFPRIAQKAIF